MGAGKTLFLTYMALQEARQGKKRILANYHLKGIPYTYITLQDLRDMVRGDINLKNTAVFLHEIDVWFDSRRSVSSDNMEGSYLVKQTNKLSCNMYYDTQSFHLVDVRIRTRTDVSVVIYKQSTEHGGLHLAVMKNENKPHLKPRKLVIWGPEVYPHFSTDEVATLSPRKSPA